MRAWLSLPILILCSCQASESPDRSLAAVHESVQAIELPPTRGYIVISLDTLRADHLGCYGYELETSPFLDRIAERSLVFENHVVQYPSTLTSHMSMLTGLYPEQHGVYPPDGVLSADVPLVQETFQEAGFTTAAFTEGGYVRGHFGFRRGFDLFKARDRSGGEEVERTFRRGFHFLESLEPDQSFFLFLHTYAVHAPYQPPETFRELIWQGAVPSGSFPTTGANLRQHNLSDELLDDATVDYLKALYDAEIRYLDSVLETFFARLEELELDRETTILITSDHGEEFQEHGKLAHEQLYHEILHVPLLLMHPGLQAGQRRTDLSQSIDLAPTLVGLAQLEAPLEYPGRNLLSGLEQRPDWSFAEASKGREAAYYQVPDGLFHLLSFASRADPGETGVVSNTELYNASQDPLESNDLTELRPELSAEILRRLSSFELEPMGESQQQELTPEVEGQLRALGYIE